MMKVLKRSKLIVLVLWIFPNTVSGQDYLNNKFLDSIVKTNYKFDKNQSLISIARQLKIDSSRSEKLQYAVLAKWVVNHMHYKNSASMSQLTKTIKTGEGVCWQYSQIMDSLAHYCNIEVEYVRGFVKNGIDKSGKIFLENHAWNLAKLDGEYYMSDITWADSGKTRKEKESNINFNYLIVSPDDFLLTHFPRKKKHLYASGSMKCFKNQPIYYSGYWLFETTSKSLNIELRYTKNEIKFTTINEKVDIIGFELYYSKNDDVIDCEEFVESKETRLSNGDKTYQIELTKLPNYSGSCTLVLLYRLNGEIQGTSVLEFYLEKN